MPRPGEVGGVIPLWRKPEDGGDWVQARCPDCGSRNRARRRRCLTCNRTGMVWKTWSRPPCRHGSMMCLRCDDPTPVCEHGSIMCPECDGVYDIDDKEN